MFNVSDFVVSFTDGSRHCVKADTSDAAKRVAYKLFPSSTIVDVVKAV